MYINIILKRIFMFLQKFLVFKCIMCYIFLIQNLIRNCFLRITFWSWQNCFGYVKETTETFLQFQIWYTCITWHNIKLTNFWQLLANRIGALNFWSNISNACSSGLYYTGFPFFLNTYIKCNPSHFPCC